MATQLSQYSSGASISTWAALLEVAAATLLKASATAKATACAAGDTTPGLPLH